MIGNLRVRTERNTEQDWLKTNLAKFSRMIEGPARLVTVGKAAAVGARFRWSMRNRASLYVHGRCGMASH